MRRAGIVLEVSNEHDETRYLKNDSDVAEEISQSTNVDSISTVTDSPPPLAAPLKPDLPNLPGTQIIETSDLDATGMATVPTTPRDKTQYQLTKADLEMIEADRKLLAARAPKGDPTTIRVFGSGDLTGRSFVFVLDRSKSMGNSGLGVIHAARQELSTAINQLEPTHFFQIVAYHHKTVTLSSRKMLSATDEHQQQVPEFIANLAAFGSTDHNNGLVSALTFRPDVIVLMTDGRYPELNATELKQIRRMAEPKCQIHCIQFGLGPLQQSDNFMRRLAEQNDGSFRYVDVSQWNEDN